MGSHPFVPYWVQNPSLVFTRRLYTLKIADGAHVAGVFIRKEDHVIWAFFFCSLPLLYWKH
jgi:hypothetical protein